MTPQSEQVLRDALALTPTDRAELVEQILASFEFPARKDIDAVWAREVEARIDACERGQIRTTPAEDVFEEIDRQVQG
ncbi:MAG TPA: addiction module protein [Sedimentisphaerales bacterium]|nr:addiction module protein [Sedimentisphaerales bacterium]HRS10767.1 addiction module protein [Sedimentisphaerales bacterium]HRV47472.1 addiction module protein [Sedimentisphaerales bacterium]